MHNVNLASASCTTRKLVLNYNMNSTVSYYRPFDSLEKKSPGVPGTCSWTHTIPYK